MEWKIAHARCVELAKRACALDIEIGRALRDAARYQAYVHLGMGSLVEYGERVFGYAPKTTIERLRVAEALEGLPRMSDELAEGRLSWSVARELTRVATPHTEDEWLTLAVDKTVREVEERVSGHKPGDSPDDDRDDRERRRVLRFEVTADVYALVREAVGALRRLHGGNIDDSDAIAMMARQVLGGPADDERASYQIAMDVCDGCGRGVQQGRGEAVRVAPEVVEQAQCDAQRVARNGHAAQDTPPATRRLVLRRDRGRCKVPGCRASVFLDIHHLDPRSEGGTHDPDRLVTLCGAHHRAWHAGTLEITGRVSTGLTFRHADGTSYGGAADPVMADRFADAYSALRNMGCSESQAKEAMERARPHVGAAAPLEEVVLRCIRALNNREQAPHVGACTPTAHP